MSMYQDYFRTHKWKENEYTSLFPSTAIKANQDTLEELDLLKKPKNKQTLPNNTD